MVVQMINVGESVGALDTMLEKIADFYDEEVDQAVENLTAMIEPFMMVFLGGMIGGLVVAMYLANFPNGWKNLILSTTVIRRFYPYERDHRHTCQRNT